MKATSLIFFFCLSSLCFGVDFSQPVEKVSGGFQFTEGPVWKASSNELLFSDIPANQIRCLKDGQFTTFRSPSNNSNGLTLDRQGRLIACEHGTRRVTRTETDGSITVLADKYQGKKLNSPNDVVVKSDGAIYFTDPPYGVKSQDRELDFQGVYRLSPDGKSLDLLVRDFIKPNGLAFSPDEKVLYIDDTDAGHIRAFDVLPDGSLGKGRILAPSPGADGMKVDSEGTIFCTTGLGVMVYAPSGRHLGTFATSERPANCAFADADLKSLYLTCRTGLYRLRMTAPGISLR